MADVDFDIEYISNLARIELDENDKQEMNRQLGQVLQFMEQLAGVELEDASGSDTSSGPVNVTREDQPRESLPHSEAMKNAPSEVNGLFQLPRIVE